MTSSKISTIDLEEPVVEALNTIDTVADQLSVVDGNINSIKATVESNANVLDTINTNAANLNTRLTSARAGYLDLLINNTYGLSALKTAISKIPTTSGGSSYTIGAYVTTINSSSTSYTATTPVFVIKAGSGQLGRVNGKVISEDSPPLLLGSGSKFERGTSISDYLVFKAVSE